ncbi:Rho GTPase-activating protein [Rhodotorula paludigena]|uniref:Rho GTPase-activating protein n=1 Tax=Rhodotorula paludigena TaxID=86838 RepID=UPI003179BB82
MGDTIPLYLSAHSPADDSGSDDGFPQPPSARTSLAPSLAAQQQAKETNRQSYRPPLPPKPTLMRRSLSAGTAAAPTAPPEPASSPSSRQPAARETSPRHWMRAIMGSPRTEQETASVASGLRLPADARETDASSAAGPGQPLSPKTGHPVRSSSRGEPPAMPPRPVLISSPTPSPTLGSFEPAPESSPSSCPPALSPFSSMSIGSADSSSGPAFAPPPLRSAISRSPERSRARPPQHPSISSTASITSSASSSSLNPSTAFGALGRGLQQAKFKDRVGAGLGFAREWGGKGKGRLQDSWRGLQTSRSTAAGESLAATSGSTSSGSGGPPSTGLAGSASTATLTSFLSPASAVGPAAADGPSSSTMSAAGAAAAAIKLPSTILGVRVPNARGQAFGQPLAPLVSATRAPAAVGAATRADDDEVTGDAARAWLPGVAFRCLQYLDEWGRKEEGIYRVPGRGQMVTQLRCMFDAGVGQEKDLREIHPGDLDPHAVASMFKGWLREIPEPLLSQDLETPINTLTLSALGYSASSTNFLAGAATSPARSPAATPGGTGVVSGTAVTASAGGPSDARAPREYLEELRELFATAMPAENYHLLRAIAYHFARLAAHSQHNKMNLSNLRLILSPTLRLSPGFLQVLVVEREILFSKSNEAARVRQASAGASSPSSPAFSTFAGPSSLPHRRSPTPGSSPLLNPPSPRTDTAPSVFAQTASSASNGSGGSWLVVEGPQAESGPVAASAEVLTASPAADEERLSPSTSPVLKMSDVASPPPSASTIRTSPQTPIADRFASTSSSRSLRPARSNMSLNSQSSASALSSSKPAFIPSRDRANGAGGGGFFGSRDTVPVPPGGGSRKGSATSIGSSSTFSWTNRNESTSSTSSETHMETLAPRSLARGESTTSLPRLSLGADFHAAIAGLDGNHETQERLHDSPVVTSLAGDSPPSTSSSSPASGSTAATSHARSRSVEPSRLRTHSRTNSASSLLATFASHVRSHSHNPLRSNSSTSIASLRRGESPAKGGGGRSASRSSTLDLTLPMPSGLGLGLRDGTAADGKRSGLGREADDEGAGGGFLSIEERKKFFGG